MFGQGFCRFAATAGVLFLGAFAADQASASTVIVPTSITGEGAKTSSAVFDVRGATIQFVYTAGDLAGIAPGSKFDGIYFRRDGGDTVAAGPTADTTFSDWTLEISKLNSNVSAGNLSTTFANNIGDNAVIVRTGQLDVAQNSYPGGTSTPHAFGPEIPFSTAYTYDGGDLLFTLTHSSTAHSVSVVDGVQVGSTAAVIQINGFSTSQYTTLIPIAQLSVTPEPASVALLGLAGIGLATRRRRVR